MTDNVIDLTPTAEGYRRIAERFADGIIGWVDYKRDEDDDQDWSPAQVRENVRHLLVSLIDIAVYLAMVDKGEYNTLKNAVRR